MEAEIEETRRQMQRGAELIQNAFEGLTELHNRVTEVTSMRNQGQAAASPDPNATGSSSREDSRNAMDPGHDAIILSSATQSDATVPVPAPTAQVNTSPSGRPRPSDPALSNLSAEILMSSESVRRRASELDELRRAIVQHSRERHRQLARSASQDTPSLPAATEVALPAPGHVISTLTSSIPARSRRLLLESSLRQAAADESATSLGAMVSVRTSASSAASGSPNAALSQSGSIHPSPSRTDVPSPAARSFAIPPGLTTRLTRLAHEIQQDISRISQQSETLMTWINEHRARLDAATSALNSNNTTPQSAESTPRPSYATIPTATTSTSTISAPRADTGVQSGATTVTVRIGADSRAESERRTEAAAVAAHPIVARPRDSPRSTQPDVSSSPSRHDNSFDGPLSRRTRREVSPVARPMPTPPGASSVLDAASSLTADPAFVDAIARVRDAIARARYARRTPSEDRDADRDEEPTESRNHRVRRRLNADGDEEVWRVPTRRERRYEDYGWQGPPSVSDADPFWRETRENRNEATASASGRREGGQRYRYVEPRSRREYDNARNYSRDGWPVMDDGDDDDDEEEWIGALTRLDALSRGTAAARAERESWMSMFGRDDRSPPTYRRDLDELAYPINLGNSSWRTSQPSRQGIEMSPNDDSEYERSIAAMRARAIALTSSRPPARSLDSASASVPPPPPPIRPLSFMSTTQTTPSSLWNDSNVRVRLRAAVSRLIDEDMRARERVQAQAAPSFSPSSASQQAAAAASHSQSQSQYTPRAPYWSFDPRDDVSPSPPLERAGRGAREGAQCARARGEAAELGRPMWGSPTPFYPSPLPLPLVSASGSGAEMSSLEARSRAFGAAKRVARVPRRGTLAGR
ncbi:hypothetical protein GY45DRAFT_1356627 [Cubamyces sp. BRFM 1775]|nr:hypothetical protein GY45DRAFT_1356627 [Cubamyces sp. BRFM 1775]